MIPYDTVEAYGSLLASTSTVALADLTDLYREVERLRPDLARDVLLQTVPLIVDPYAVAMGDLGATFYEQVREESGVAGSFAARSVETPEQPRYESLVRWSVAPLFEPGPATALTLLAGGVQRILMDSARDSIVHNGSLDKVKVGYQRVPSAGCCAFCGMLASRAAVYDSKGAAERVVGRGVPIGKHRLARGVRPRGTRNIGERYHDFCACKGVPVFEDNYVEMQSDSKKYFEAYGEARDNVNAGLTLETVTAKSADGSLKNTYTWVNDSGAVTSKDKTKLIAAGMRAALGVK